MDATTMAREAAIDLVGKFFLSKEDLISKFYEGICGRILDTGVSVRKRVMKIFKENGIHKDPGDLCHDDQEDQGCIRVVASDPRDEFPT